MESWNSCKIGETSIYMGVLPANSVADCNNQQNVLVLHRLYPIMCCGYSKKGCNQAHTPSWMVLSTARTNYTSTTQNDPTPSHKQATVRHKSASQTVSVTVGNAWQGTYCIPTTQFAANDPAASPSRRVDCSSDAIIMGLNTFSSK